MYQSEERASGSHNKNKQTKQCYQLPDLSLVVRENLGGRLVVKKMYYGLEKIYKRLNIHQQEMQAGLF